MSIIPSTPCVSTRSRTLISTTDDETKLVFDFEDVAAAKITIFGKSPEDLKLLLKFITTNQLSTGGTFLSEAHVVRALNTGLLNDFMGDTNKFGSLSEIVKELVKSLDGPSLSEGQRTLLWMLTMKEKKDKAQQREHLTELILFLADLATQGEDNLEIRDRTKHLVLFLLRFVLPDITPKKYETILGDMGLPIPSVDSAKETDLYRTLAKKSIIANMVGSNAMDSVVELFDSKAKAFSALDPAKQKKDKQKKDPMILPSQAAALQDYWATDDFDGDKAEKDLNKELNFWMTGDPGSDDASREDNLSDIAAGGTAVMQPAIAGFETESMQRPTAMPGTSWTIDPNDPNVVQALSMFQCLETISAKYDSGELNLSEIGEMRRLIQDIGTKAKLVLPTSTLLTVDTNTAAAAVPDEVASSLTVLNEPEPRLHQEGLSITEEGLRSCFQSFYKLRSSTKYKHLKHLAKESIMPANWKTDAPTPQTNNERALAGQLWTIDDIEILGILGGGNFGRVLKVRHKRYKNFRAVVKGEPFSLSDFCVYGRRETVDGSEVQHINLVRTLGYMFIPCVGDHHKPIGLGLIQEEGRYNLRKVVVELNHSDLILSARDKLRKAISIMVEILAGVEALEDAGLIHRDIKPENVVFFKDGHWKLVDFGLARQYDADGTMSDNAGTITYLPPEGKGPKVDPFASGITCFELMSGETPAGEVPTRPEIAAAFNVGLVKEGRDAIALCEKLTLYSEEERWTGKIAASKANALFKSLSE